jgi:hypothetical protein
MGVCRFLAAHSLQSKRRPRQQIVRKSERLARAMNGSTLSRFEFLIRTSDGEGRLWIVHARSIGVAKAIAAIRSPGTQTRYRRQRSRHHVIVCGVRAGPASDCRFKIKIVRKGKSGRRKIRSSRVARSAMPRSRLNDTRFRSQK